MLKVGLASRGAIFVCGEVLRVAVYIGCLCGKCRYNNGRQAGPFVHLPSAFTSPFAAYPRARSRLAN